MIVRIKINSSSRKHDISLLFAVIFFVFSWAPMKSDTTLNVTGIGFSLRSLYVICTVLLAVFFLPRMTKRFSKYSLLTALCPLMYFGINTFHAYRPVSANFSVIALMLLFALYEDEIKTKSIEYIRMGITAIAAVGIVCWVCATLRIPLPYARTIYYSSDAQALGYYYRNYLHLCYLIEYSRIGFFRLCGIFNESGEFGVFLGLLLCIDRVNLKKRENLVLLVAGCMTLSLAFFVILALYVMYANRHSLKIVTLVGSGLLFLLCVPGHVMTGVASIDALLVRISRSLSGSVGAGRISMQVNDFLKNRFFREGKWLYGYGTAYVANRISGGGSSLLITVIEQGVLGTALLYGFPLLIMICKHKRYSEAIVYILLNYVSFYQRPYLYNIAYFIMLFGGVEQVRTLKWGNAEKLRNLNPLSEAYRCKSV